MPDKKKDTKALRLRNSILIFVVVVVMLVLGYGTLYSTGVTEGEYLAGEHYRVIDSAPARRPGEALTVDEYFSYGCVHCKNFDPLIEEWRESLPEGVTFSRSPIAFSPTWTLLAQTYFTLEYLDILEQNHTRFFNAIHDRGIQFLSAEQVADFVDGRGASREEFLQAFNSPEVRRALREADAAQRRIQINSVPTLVVADKYVINMDNGRKVALEIANQLIAEELNGSSN
jgi:protein dithiol oxidoreductase (disulfide-forming)